MKNTSLLYSKQTATTWFYIFLALHLLVWTLTPALIYGNPPNDSLESIVWGNLWQLGYNKQPFLAPWLSASFTDLFHTVGWPIYLLSQISIVICFWAVWRLASKMLPVWYAFIAVLLLEGINYYNLQSAVFDPNILMLPLWALMTLCFYNALQQNKTRDWILLGIFTGLAMLAKYESFVLMFVFFIFLLSYQEGRKTFKNYKLYLGALVAFFILLPNLIWLFAHHLDAIHYAVGEMKNNRFHHLPFILKIFYEPFEFTLEQLGNIAPLFLLYLPFYQMQQEQLQLSPFNRRFLLFLTFGPLTFTLLFSLFTGACLISRWAFPFFTFIGVLWVAWLKPVLSNTRLYLFVGLLALVTILMVAGDIYAFIYRPYVTHKAPHSASFPGQNIALSLTTEWRNLYKVPLPYVAGDRHLINNIAAFSPDKPIPYFEWSKSQSPWIKNKSIREKGAVFVIWLNAPYEYVLAKNIEERYPNLVHQSIQEYQRLTHAKVAPVKIWVAFLPPHSNKIQVKQ